MYNVELFRVATNDFVEAVQDTMAAWDAGWTVNELWAVLMLNKGADEFGDEYIADLEEPWDYEEPIDLEMGFDPYMGDYSYDC